MVECPECGRKHQTGTLFCDVCGAYLSTGSRLSTDPLPEEELSAPRASLWAADTQADSASETPIAVRITILGTGRQVQLLVAPEIMLGRLDAAHAVFPDLDLTSDGGLDGGVSRRHAKIQYQDGRLLIEDLGSVNGTLVNGKRLTPYLPHPLQAGYELQLGRLGLRIEFDYCPS